METTAVGRVTRRIVGSANRVGSWLPDMGQQPSRRARRLLPVLAVIIIGALGATLGAGIGSAGAVPLSISIQGNHFVDGAGQTVRLLGVNHPSLEYACEEGYAYDDGNMDAADASAIASWHATAVRIPLNEDCWLGINGQPSNSQNPVPPLTSAGYRQEVQSYVSALNNAGLYVILDLHWTAPGALPADGQRAMPDDHSAAFWSSVASTFASNPAVVFDAFNEPYSPAAVNDPNRPVSWDCWKSGGCPVPDDNDSVANANDATVYTAVGMQALVNAIRATGARQPILLGGLNYANDLTQWLAHEPSDPLGQLAASFHNYQGLTCDNAACWDAQVAPVAAQVPVVGGEFDQDVCNASTFDVDYMNWADLHGVSYLAWGWWVLSPQEIADAGCSAYYLVSDPAGTPAAPNGVNLHDHLATLAAGATPPATTPTTTTPTPGPGTGPSTKPAAPDLRAYHAQQAASGSSVRFVLRSDQSSSGVISARTAAMFPVGAKHRRRHVSLGSVGFKLKAGSSQTIVLALSRSGRALLARRHSLKAQVTITLIGTGHQKGVSRHTLTLKAPARH
jgi:endoglucanase